MAKLNACYTNSEFVGDSSSFDNGAENKNDKNSIQLDLKDNPHIKVTKSGKVKVPRRLIHCSDGILEEYSTDEEEVEEEPTVVVDPKTLSWGPYVWYQMVRSATGTLAVCDYLGEKLAWFFGITSPKYQYALDEIKRQEEEEKEQEELEKAERDAETAIVHEYRSNPLSKEVNNDSDDIND